jgi:hypothetical protein
MFLSSIFSKSGRRGRTPSDPRERSSRSAASPDLPAQRPFLLDLIDRWGRR